MKEVCILLLLHIQIKTILRNNHVFSDLVIQIALLELSENFIIS